MSMRVVHIGVSLPRRGRPRTISEVEAVVTFQPNTFTELRRAARQTHLPIQAYVQEVVEADLATRRLTNPPLPGAKTRE